MQTCREVPVCLLPQTVCLHSYVSFTTKVHTCTKFHCYRTQHKQVIGKTAFHCLRLFVVVYKLVIYVTMNSYHGTSVYHQCSFIVRGPTISKLDRQNTIYMFLLPEGVCCCLQTCNVYILMMGCITLVI